MGKKAIPKYDAMVNNMYASYFLNDIVSSRIVLVCGIIGCYLI
jgi:hypothetical protein